MTLNGRQVGMGPWENRAISDGLITAPPFYLDSLSTSVQKAEAQDSQTG